MERRPHLTRRCRAVNDPTVMAPVVSEWSVDEVLAMLDGLGLAHLKQPFKENGVNGKLLVTLHEKEFIEVGTATQLFCMWSELDRVAG